MSHGRKKRKRLKVGTVVLYDNYIDQQIGVIEEVHEHPKQPGNYTYDVRKANSTVFAADNARLTPIDIDSIEDVERYLQEKPE